MDRIWPEFEVSEGCTVYVYMAEGIRAMGCSVCAVGFTD